MGDNEDKDIGGKDEDEDGGAEDEYGDYDDVEKEGEDKYENNIEKINVKMDTK